MSRGKTGKKRFMPEDPATVAAVAILETLQWDVSWETGGPLGKLTRAIEHLARTGSMQITEFEGELH